MEGERKRGKEGEEEKGKEGKKITSTSTKTKICSNL